MNISSIRPDVSDLSFHAFGRSLHPELFRTCSGARLRHSTFSAELRICEAGHVVCFQHNGQTITEIASTSRQLLPQRKRLLGDRIRGCHTASIRLDGGIVYHVSFQLEKLEPEVFLNVHEELLLDSERAEVSHHFRSGNRLSPDPLSLIRADLCHDSLAVHTFHTFPESCAVVKTQSLFEM